MGQNLRGTEKIKFDLVEKYENALFFHHKPVIDRFLGVYGLDLNLVITQSDVPITESACHNKVIPSGRNGIAAIRSVVSCRTRLPPSHLRCSGNLTCDSSLIKDVWLLPTRLHFVDADGYLVLSLLKTLRAENVFKCRNRCIKK